MASSYPGPVSAIQVGSYFVGQYYQVLQKQPHLAHQFYAETSKVIHVNGDSSQSASTLLEISTLLVSLSFNAIEIKTINSLESWNGGILVMVSGSVMTKDYRREFVQTFFLAPQEQGYFVLNDILKFTDLLHLPDEPGILYQQLPNSMSSENIYQQHRAPKSLEDTLDSQVNAPSPHAEPTAVPKYGLEEEAGKYVSSVPIEDDPVDKYSLPEQPQQQDFETEIVVEETPVEETSASFQDDVNAAQDMPAASVEEQAEEPPRKTYASVLQVSKGPFSSSVTSQTSLKKSAPTTSDWNHVAPPTNQQSDSAWSFVPESGFEAAEGSLGPDEGEPKSVYVRNLPSDVTSEEIEHEFKNFGRIKPDGVFVRNRKDVVGVCYAFVEFEDLISVQNAIKASPILLAGRQVYIEERRPNTSIALRGGRGRGRGRGSYQTDAARGRFGARSLGRFSHQDGGDYNRLRGNGFYQRGSRLERGYYGTKFELEEH